VTLTPVGSRAGERGKPTLLLFRPLLGGSPDRDGGIERLACSGDLGRQHGFVRSNGRSFVFELIRIVAGCLVLGDRSEVALAFGGQARRPAEPLA
jgi:hypothetical protein